MEELKKISKDSAISKGLKRYFTGIPCNNGHVDERAVKGSKCYQCCRDRSNKRYLEDPEYVKKYQKYNPESKKKYYDKRREELSLEINKKKWKRKGIIFPNRIGEVCEICGKPETWDRNGKIKRLALDHCHERNIFRGWLCAKHNAMLGCAGDDPGILRKAADYLEKFNLNLTIKLEEGTI